MIDYANLSKEQAAELLAQRKQEIAALKAVVKGQEPGAVDATGGSVNKVLSTANALARATEAASKANARVTVTQADYDAAVTAYCTRYSVTELPTDVVQRVAASQAKAIENMRAAHEKISAKLKGRTATIDETETTGEAETEAEVAAD